MPVSSSLWNLPLPGTVKANFDVAVKSDFAVAAMVLSDFNGNIVQAITKRLSSTNAAIGKAQAALLAIQSAASLWAYSLILEGDAINIILAIQKPDLFKDWNFASIVSDINFFFAFFS
jgi:Na+-transporting NADH:ubiquinone oxidoreductase subunit NqrE